MMFAIRLLETQLISLIQTKNKTMKTLEEIYEAITKLPLLSNIPELARTESYKLIEEIQTEAFREGMTAAAKVCDARKDHCSSAMARLQSDICAEQILKVRDEKV